MTLPPEELPLQRLFSSFPDGWSGLGLLLLRAVVVASAILGGVDLFSANNLQKPAGWVLALLGAIAAAAILLGLLTPIAGVLEILVNLIRMAILFAEGGFRVRPDIFAILSAILLPLALALLGPGAYSIDARLFGHKEIVITQSSGSDGV